MIDLNVDNVYILDLQDDFIMNDSEDLYQFIDKDPVRAFYLGANVKDWFEKLDAKQQYLHSKLIRHNKDDLQKYLEQVQFWSNKYSDEKEIDLKEDSEYILNNMFWDDEDNDPIKLAFFLGQNYRNSQIE